MKETKSKKKFNLQRSNTVHKKKDNDELKKYQKIGNEKISIHKEG